LILLIYSYCRVDGPEKYGQVDLRLHWADSRAKARTSAPRYRIRASALDGLAGRSVGQGLAGAALAEVLAGGVA
jgi:hypothetical protein